MLSKDTFKFLKELKKNNNKEWFDDNRSVYEIAKADFVEFTNDLIKGISKFDAKVASANLDPKKCISRINRDIRFSKDKTPYKPNFFAIVNCEGKKSNLAGYYMQVQPGASFSGGGSYMPMPPDLQDIRKEIQYNLADWKKVVEAKSFLKMFPEGVQAPEILQRIPKGFEDTDPAAEYLKMKGYYTWLPFTDADLQSKDAIKKVLKSHETAETLVGFINKALR